MKGEASQILEYIKLVLLRAMRTRPGPAHVSDPTVLLKFCPHDISNFFGATDEQIERVDLRGRVLEYAARRSSKCKC